MQPFAPNKTPSSACYNITWLHRWFQDNIVNVGARGAACADAGQPIHAWWRGLTAPVLVDQLDCSVRRTDPGGHAASDTPEAHPLAKERLGGGRPSATEGLALGPGKASLFQGYAHRGPLHLR